ncbi:MAG: nuclear transport factor 2 family protein [Parasphingorhabdus sp.]|uniref:nuclear transport factor 2 family protein n=1 Tax=Parasphingorhabdus sp. TaxID=2709688 RepID=UPI0032986D15
MTNAYSQTPSERTTNMSNTETTAATEAGEAQSFAEYEAVAKALSPYIDAAKTGDGELSRTAFYDHANIVGSINGEISYPNADAFAKNVSNIGPSPEVQSRIAWIDISGPAAAAKVEFLNWSGLRFTDLFVLYKADGQWKISGKVYDSHANN